MKNIFKYYIAIALILSSCDYLDLNPVDKFSEVVIWDDVNLIEAYVNAAYRSIPQELQQEPLSTACDETYCIHNWGNPWVMLRGELNQDNVGSVMGNINLWGGAYKNIHKINVFFEKIENSIINEESKGHLIGEMKFLRAFIYSHLIWRYGGVPIIASTYELDDEFNATRSTYADCVKFIVDELDEAIKLLPDKQPESKLGRASADACRALKSRVLLYNASLLNNSSNDKQKWQEAAEAAEILLNSNYSLNDDYQGTFLENNNEVIFARFWSQANYTDITLWYGRNGSNGQGGIGPTQNMVDAYGMKTGTYDPNNPYANRDPRFYASILYNGGIWAGRETETFKGGLDSSESPIEAWNASMTGYYLKKFMPENIPPRGSGVYSTSPFIYFRYAEILLNYAEAKFELGDEETAREYLNKVRARASVQMPNVIASGEELRKAIHNERRVELFYEGHRFFDVRRWKTAMDIENKPIIAMTIEKEGDGKYKYKTTTLLERYFADQHYLIPIPREEINKSLGSLDQNPNY